MEQKSRNGRGWERLLLSILDEHLPGGVASVACKNRRRSNDLVANDLLAPIEHQEQGEIALEFLRDEEIFFHVLVAVFSEFCGDFRVR